MLCCAKLPFSTLVYIQFDYLMQHDTRPQKFLEQKATTRHELTGYKLQLGIVIDTKSGKLVV
jgi:uncharacterized protein with NRDE domain